MLDVWMPEHWSFKFKEKGSNVSMLDLNDNYSLQKSCTVERKKSTFF